MRVSASGLAAGVVGRPRDGRLRAAAAAAPDPGLGDRELHADGGPAATATPPATPERSSSAGGPHPTTSGGAAVQLRQLPRGGREIFPAYRLVGFAGAPGSTASAGSASAGSTTA